MELFRLSKFNVSTVRAGVNFLHHTVANAVVDLHGVLIHLSATDRANHLWFIHIYVPVVRGFQSALENILANCRAMLRSRSRVALNRRYPSRCYIVA